jgi:hypothetical protein
LKPRLNTITTPRVAATPKIALCLEYPIGQHGGTEALVRELIDGFAGHHPIVLVSDDESGSVLSAPSLQEKIEQHFRWNPTQMSFANSRNMAVTLCGANVALAHFHFGGNFAWGARQLNLSPAIHLRRLGVPCLTTNHGVFGALDGYIGAQRSLLTKLLLLPAAWLGKIQVLETSRRKSRFRRTITARCDGAIGRCVLVFVKFITRAFTNRRRLRGGRENQLLSAQEQWDRAKGNRSSRTLLLKSPANFRAGRFSSSEGTEIRPRLRKSNQSWSDCQSKFCGFKTVQTVS